MRECTSRFIRLAIPGSSLGDARITREISVFTAVEMCVA